jgi:DnaJ-domain-containing protein 1
MNNISNYLWIILLVIYIISPFDAHPLVLDDLIASGFLLYMLYKNARQKKQQQQYHEYSGQSQSSQQTYDNQSTGPLTLDKAYRLLGVDSTDSLDNIAKAYKDKIIKSHPDKVSHLSKELQDKAKELTLNLNEAYDLIKKYKKS